VCFKAFAASSALDMIGEKQWLLKKGDEVLILALYFSYFSLFRIDRKNDASSKGCALSRHNRSYHPWMDVAKVSLTCHIIFIEKKVWGVFP
jgi:hypothetical protein